MRFLVDAQLPPALARWLAERGHEAAHVGDLGFLETSDGVIWKRAVETGATLVTKDQDFVALQSANPVGPAVVWIRLGNTSRRALLDGFASLLPDIECALAGGERLIEIAHGKHHATSNQANP